MRAFSVRRSSSTTLVGSELGDGRAVVCVHAGVADRRSWFEVLELLARHDVRGIAYDQRGYGDTVCGAEPYSASDDLAALLDDRGIDQAVLVGASRGGQIALETALATSDRVAALMLIGSAPGDAPFPPPAAELADLFAAIEAADDAGDLDAVNELEARLWLDGPSAEPHRVAGPARDLFLDMNGRALAATECGEPEPFAPTWKHLPELQIPVTVAVGDLDNPGLRGAAEETAARIPNASFRVFEGTAHLPMLEQPAKVAEEITELLGRT